MKRYSAILILAVAACTETSSGSSGGFVAPGGVRVTPVSQDVFEVAARPGSNMAGQLWCGAGEYARRTFGAPPNARVYVVGGTGPGTVSAGRDTAQFSLKTPDQASGATGRASSWGPRLGEEKFVGDASRHCHSYPNRFAP